MRERRGVTILAANPRSPSPIPGKCPGGRGKSADTGGSGRPPGLKRRGGLGERAGYREIWADFSPPFFIFSFRYLDTNGLLCYFTVREVLTWLYLDLKRQKHGHAVGSPLT
jgi:hypothetical protein